MSKILFCTIVMMTTRVMILSAFIGVAFITSTLIGASILALLAISMLADYIKYREEVKLTNKATAELMQYVAAKNGEGNC